MFRLESTPELCVFRVVSRSRGRSPSLRSILPCRYREPQAHDSTSKACSSRWPSCATLSREALTLLTFIPSKAFPFAAVARRFPGAPPLTRLGPDDMRQDRRLRVSTSGEAVSRVRRSAPRYRPFWGLSPCAAHRRKKLEPRARRSEGQRLRGGAPHRGEGRAVVTGRAFDRTQRATFQGWRASSAGRSSPSVERGCLAPAVALQGVSERVGRSSSLAAAHHEPKPVALIVALVRFRCLSEFGEGT